MLIRSSKVRNIPKLKRQERMDSGQGENTLKYLIGNIHYHCNVNSACRRMELGVSAQRKF